MNREGNKSSIITRNTMNAQVTHLDPIRIVMLRHTGPYDALGPVFEKLWGWVESHNIPAERWIGIYWDNPDEVPTEKLRSPLASRFRPTTKSLTAVDSVSYLTKSRVANMPRQLILAHTKTLNKFGLNSHLIARILSGDRSLKIQHLKFTSMTQATLRQTNSSPSSICR